MGVRYIGSDISVEMGGVSSRCLVWTVSTTINVLFLLLFCWLNPTVEFLQSNNLSHREYYLTSADWIGNKNTKISAVWMNRAQNLSIITACEAPEWKCIEVSIQHELNISSVGYIFGINFYSKLWRIYVISIATIKHYE